MASGTVIARINLLATCIGQETQDWRPQTAAPGPRLATARAGEESASPYLRAMAMQSSRNAPALLVSRTRSNAVSRTLISSVSLIWGSSVSM